MRPFAALLLLLPLAGCAAPLPGGGDAPTPEGTLPDGTLAWGLTSCRYLVGWSPVDPARLQVFLPEGFRPAPFTGAPGVGGQGAMLGLETFTCESGAGLDGTVPEMAYGSLWTTVFPPEELEEEGAAFYTVRWDTLIPDDPRREVMLAAGMPARSGEVTWGGAPAPVAAASRLRMDEAGSFGLTMATQQSRAAPRETTSFVEFTPTEDGRLAVWRADYAWDGDTYATGTGALEFDASSWAYRVTQAPRLPAQLHAGTWTFSNGTLTLPS